MIGQQCSIARMDEAHGASRADESRAKAEANEHNGVEVASDQTTRTTVVICHNFAHIAQSSGTLAIVAVGSNETSPHIRAGTARPLGRMPG